LTRLTRGFLFSILPSFFTLGIMTFLLGKTRLKWRNYRLFTLKIGADIFKSVSWVLSLLKFGPIFCSSVLHQHFKDYKLQFHRSYFVVNSIKKKKKKNTKASRERDFLARGASVSFHQLKDKKNDRIETLSL
jgi:hypothetical protein